MGHVLNGATVPFNNKGTHDDKEGRTIPPFSCLVSYLFSPTITEEYALSSREIKSRWLSPQPKNPQRPIKSFRDVGAVKPERTTWVWSDVFAIMKLSTQSVSPEVLSTPSSLQDSLRFYPSVFVYDKEYNLFSFM